MDDVLKSGNNESNPGYDNIDGFVDEVLKIENEMAVYFKNTQKDTIMTEEDEKHYRKNICRFCEKEKTIDKVRDHCHLTGNYRSPAHQKCNVKATQKQSNFIPFVFLIFSNYDCHLFFQKFS